MQITPFTVYIWQLLDSICIASVMLSIATLIAACLSLAVYSSEGDPEGQPYLRWFKRLIAIALGLVAVAIFTPSSQAFALIVVLPKISQSDVIQKDAPELYKMAVEAIKANLKPE